MPRHFSPIWSLGLDLKIKVGQIRGGDRQTIVTVFGWCSFGCSQLLSAGGIPARGSEMGGGRATVALGRWCRPAERLLVASWTAWAAQSSWNRPSSRPAAVSGAAEHGDWLYQQWPLFAAGGHCCSFSLNLSTASLPRWWQVLLLL